MGELKKESAIICLRRGIKKPAYPGGSEVQSGFEPLYEVLQTSA